MTLLVLLNRDLITQQKTADPAYTCTYDAADQRPSGCGADNRSHRSAGGNPYSGIGKSW